MSVKSLETEPDAVHGGCGRGHSGGGIGPAESAGPHHSAAVHQRHRDGRDLMLRPLLLDQRGERLGHALVARVRLDHALGHGWRGGSRPPKMAATAPSVYILGYTSRRRPPDMNCRYAIFALVLVEVVSPERNPRGPDARCRTAWPGGSIRSSPSSGPTFARLRPGPVPRRPHRLPTGLRQRRPRAEGAALAGLGARHRLDLEAVHRDEHSAARSRTASSAWTTTSATTSPSCPTTVPGSRSATCCTTPAASGTTPR